MFFRRKKWFRFKVEISPKAQGPPQVEASLEEATRGILLGDLAKDLRALFGIKTHIDIEGWAAGDEFGLTFRAALNGHPLKGSRRFADHIESIRRHAATLLEVRLQPSHSFTVAVLSIDERKHSEDRTPVGMSSQ